MISLIKRALIKRTLINRVLIKRTLIKIVLKTPFLLISLLTYLLTSITITTAQASVTVTFAGSLSNANPGPFETNAKYSGTFNLDESIIPTGPNNYFVGAVTDFTVSIVETTGTTTFTGTGGLLKQFSNTKDTADFITIELGGSKGIVNGSTLFKYIDTKTGLPEVFLFTLKKISFDLRGSSLFESPLTVYSNFDSNDLWYQKFTMEFDRPHFYHTINDHQTFSHPSFDHPSTNVPIANRSSINTLESVTFGDGQASTLLQPSFILLVGLIIFTIARRLRK